MRNQVKAEEYFILNLWCWNSFASGQRVVNITIKNMNHNKKLTMQGSYQENGNTFMPYQNQELKNKKKIKQQEMGRKWQWLMNLWHWLGDRIQCYEGLNWHPSQACKTHPYYWTNPLVKKRLRTERARWACYILYSKEWSSHIKNSYDLVMCYFLLLIKFF